MTGIRRGENLDRLSREEIRGRSWLPRCAGCARVTVTHGAVALGAVVKNCENVCASLLHFRAGYLDGLTSAEGFDSLLFGKDDHCSAPELGDERLIGELDGGAEIVSGE